jgi:hypothetical protein
LYALWLILGREFPFCDTLVATRYPLDTNKIG